MRNIISIVFAVATVLVGCHSPSMVHTQTPAPTLAAPPPFRPMFITTRGTNTTPDGAWRIAVSVADGSVYVTRLKELRGDGWTDSVSVTTSPDGWIARSGWFVFIESESRVWAYDGDRVLILNTYTSSGNNSSGATYSSRFPCAVPTVVFSRLSEPAQKAIEPHE